MYDELVSYIRGLKKVEIRVDEDGIIRLSLVAFNNIVDAAQEAADAIEELSKFSNSLQRLKAEGWCLERTKYDESGATIQAMKIPEPPKEEEA